MYMKIRKTWDGEWQIQEFDGRCNVQYYAGLTL